MLRLLLFCCVLKPVQSEPILETRLAAMHGVYNRIFGVDIESYLGIPYALPPIGSRRYAYPEPYEKFEQRMFNASKYPPACPQTILDGRELINKEQSEDCLYLNIFRRRGTVKNDHKSVLVVIHDGDFIRGSSSDPRQAAETLLAFGDIILVSFNYRLGVLGFVNFNRYAPGNLGLWDQRLALRWVRINIGEYGGNPDAITVMGTGSGSMSIAAHLMTQIDKIKLFQSVIMDAGVLTSSALLEDATTSYRRISRVAHYLGCPINSPRMVECLRHVDLYDLIRASTKFRTDNGISTFIPAADGEYIPGRTEQFVAMEAFQMLKVRMMIGYASDEGTVFIDRNVVPFETSDLWTRKATVEQCKNISTKFNYALDIKNNATIRLMANLYLGEEQENAFKVTAEFLGDGSFKCPINHFIKHYGTYNDRVYAYHFERRFNKTYTYTYRPQQYGVFHSSPYLHFVGSLFLTEKDIYPLDREFMYDTMKMIADFVSSDGAPSFRGVTWPSHSLTKKVLIISNDTVEVREGLPSDFKCEKLFISPYETGKIWYKPEL